MSYERLYPFPPFEEPEMQEKEPKQDRPQTLQRIASSRAAQALLSAALMLSDPTEAEAKKPRRSHAAQQEQHSSRSTEKKRTVRPDTENVVPTKKFSLNSREDNGIVREIEAAKRMNLEHYRTEADLKEALEAGKLVSIIPDEEDGYVIDPGLGELAKPESRYLYMTLLAESAEQLKQLADRFYQKFHEKIHVNSATRTDAYVDLLRKNGNKNTASGYTSTHLLGTTVDILYFGPETKRRTQEYRMTDAQIKWLSVELLKLEESGKVLATKERAQPCFHVMFVPAEVKATKIINLDE